MREYDEIAGWYAEARDPAVGVPDLEAFARTLPPGARVLDLGCGTGVPVSRLLLRAGADLTALDSSAAMIERYRANVPGVPAHCVRAQDAAFAPESFDAVVAWGVLFHAAETDQRAILARVAAWLAPGGRFLFTSGDVAGVAESRMGGVPFRYVSLGADAYRRLLEEDGLRLERHHTDAWENHVYVAVKPLDLGASGATETSG